MTDLPLPPGPRDAPGAGLLGEDVMVPTPDGRKLRTMVRGEGEDLVVLEAGLGSSGLYWGRVHEGIGSAARVVAYDRAGYGGSDPDGARRDLARLAADLLAVVEAFPHRRLVLVGHSWGGPIVRTAAARLLAEGRPIDGLVLVDQSDENSGLYFSPMVRATLAVQRGMLRPLRALGLLARMNAPLAAGLPEELSAAVIAASTSARAVDETIAEDRCLTDGLRGLRDDPPALGDIAVRVLSGQHSAGAADRRIRASLIAAHRATAEAHPRGAFVPAHDSGHMIPVTEPELIVSETLALLAPRA